MDDFATTTRAAPPPDTAVMPALVAPIAPPPAPPAPPAASEGGGHELRILATIPVPSDPLAQAKMIAALDTHIEGFRAAIEAASPSARVDVGVVRIKHKADKA